MHATRILRRCLSSVFDSMHAARSRRLLLAVEALVQGRRLSLTDLARSWPGATWIHAPLKALDRLLSNRRLHQAIGPLQKAMAQWLIRHPQPVVLVDWSDLKRDQRWCLLRASVPVGGRALTVYEEIFPIARQGQPRAQIEFLQTLKQLIPDDVRPILVTDAGFRSDWYRAVRALGWHFVGRFRNNTQVRAIRAPQWRPCACLHAKATALAQDLGPHLIVKGNPMEARMVLIKRRAQGKSRHTSDGQRTRATNAKKARKRAREPWLLASSLSPDNRSASQIVAMYAKRMQIEEAFRDLKSHRYGVGFEDSLTRCPERLAVLLLLHALATFAAWLLSLAVGTSTPIDPLTRHRTHRRRYSQHRRGWEWLRRDEWPPTLRTSLTRRHLTYLVESSLCA